MNTLSLRSRLTLWYAIVLVVMLCLFGADIVWLLGGLGVQRIDRELADAEATVIKIVGNELKEQEPPADAAAEAAETVADQDLAVAILDARGVPLASPSPRPCRQRRVNGEFARVRNISTERISWFSSRCHSPT